MSELDATFTKDRSDKDDLHVICSENSIYIQFNEERVPTKSFDRLLGRFYNLTIIDVIDPAGNVMEPYTFESNFACRAGNPGLTIEYPLGQESPIYLPHQPIILNAVITNGKSYPNQNVDEQWSRTSLELGLDLVSSEDQIGSQAIFFAHFVSQDNKHWGPFGACQRRQSSNSNGVHSDWVRGCNNADRHLQK